MASGCTIKIKERSFLALLAAKKLKVQRVAMVLGYTIHLHNTTKGSFLSNRQWLLHELAHVQQYRQHGILRFLLLYIWYSIRYGYSNNPFEVEARQKESETRN